MRDPHTGAFGVVGLVRCPLKIAAIDALPASIRPQLLVLAPGLGRWAIVLLATAFPYGRPGGLGAPLKTSATRRACVIASVLPVVCCIIVGGGNHLRILAGVAALAAAGG
jgi:adenosylcobinamide-GDP ribazoletransferase